MSTRVQLESSSPPTRAQPSPSRSTDSGIDPRRRPVVFGWLLYRQQAFAGRIHLETLYRYDRVGVAGTQAAAPLQASGLQPSPYYGQSTGMLRALMRVQQHTRLPQAPAGCHWQGPILVADAGRHGTAPPDGEYEPYNAATLPAAMRDRLVLAGKLARRLLQQRQT